MSETSKLHVLMVADPISQRPRSLYTLELGRGLMEMGHDVLILTSGQETPTGKRYQWIPIKVEPALARPLLRSLSLGTLFGELRDWGAQVLHVQSLRALSVGHLVGSHLGVPTVISVHASGERLRGLRALVRNGAQVIVFTESVRQDLVNRGRVAKESIRVVPIGVPDRPARMPTSWADRRARRIPVVATVGELESGSGVRFFLEAAQQVLQSGTQAEFLIIGTGPERYALRKLTEQLGIKLRVSFCDPSPDVVEQLSAVDIFVVTSLDEAHRPVTLEAMVEGKPVVAFSVGAIFDAIEEDEAGLIVEKGDSRELARAMQRLVSKPDFAMRLARRAQEVVRTRFSLRKTLEETITCYHSLIQAEASSSVESTTRADSLPPKTGRAD